LIAQPDAHHEDQKYVRIGPAAPRDPYRPERRPEQQIDADGAIEARELYIVVQGAENSRQLVRGPGMELDSVGEPPPALADALQQLRP
jgi:hypothetical protein